MSSTRKARCEARWALVLEELDRRVAEEQAHLAERGAGNTDCGAELRPLEPRARLVRELQAEHVVVEANRGFEVFHRDPDVMQTFHGSSVVSWG